MSENTYCPIIYANCNTTCVFSRKGHSATTHHQTCRISIRLLEEKNLSDAPKGLWYELNSF